MSDDNLTFRSYARYSGAEPTVHTGGEQVSDVTIEVGSRWRLKGGGTPVEVLAVLRRKRTTIVYEAESGFVAAIGAQGFLEHHEPISRPIKRGQVWATECHEEIVVCVLEGTVTTIAKMPREERYLGECYPAEEFRRHFTYVRDTEIVEEEL